MKVPINQKYMLTITEAVEYLVWGQKYYANSLPIIRKYQFVTENAGGLSEKKWRTMWQELALEKKEQKEKYSDC